MDIRPLGTSSGSILKLLLFPSFCISSRKIIILYGILFYFIHVYSVSSPRARWDSPWGQFCWWKQKGLIILITDCMFQKLAMPSDVMHTFSWFSTMDFPETIVVCDHKVNRYSQLNEYMKLYEYQRSRSFTDLGPYLSDSIFLNLFSSITTWLIEAKFPMECP